MNRRPLPILSLIVSLLALLWAGCTAQPALSQTPTLNPTIAPTATHSLTPTASPTSTVTFTATKRPTLTFVPTRTATRDLSPKTPSVTIGKGLAGDVAHSPDGKLLAIQQDGVIKFFNSETLELVGEYTGEGVAEWESIEFAPFGRYLILSRNYSAYILDLDSQQIVAYLGGGWESSAWGFTFSRDNRYMAYGTSQHSSSATYESIGVIAFDPADSFSIPTPTPPSDPTQEGINWGYPILNFENRHTMSVPAISPDDRWLAAGFHDSTSNLLYIWELKTGAIHLMIPSAAEINSVDFSPDGRFLACGGDDGVLRLFNPTTGYQERIITDFTNSITRLRFRADDNQIIVSVSDQPDQVYDLVSGKLQPLSTPESTPDPFLTVMHQQGYADNSGVLFSPGGKMLAIGGQSVQLWNIQQQSVIVSLENPYGTLLGWAFYANGSRLGGITRDGHILVWDTASGVMILTLRSDLLEVGQEYYDYAAGGAGIGPAIGAGRFTGQGIAFSPDGRQIAFGNGNGIEIWDIASASNVIRMVQPVAPAYATRVSFSVDGKRLYAVINHNRDAQIWDVASGKLLKELDLPAVDSNAFSATALNGPLFARNNYDQNDYWVELWNLETGKMFKLPTRARETEPLHFSPDGSLLIALSDRHLYFWNTATGGLLDWMPLDTSLPWLAISPDNTTLAVGQEGQAQLWDISAIGAAALQSSFTPAAPPPTATPWNDYPTVMPQPTAPFTMPDLPTLPAGAISPANVAQIGEVAHFGRGTLNEMIWASAPLTLLTAGPQGVYAFGGNPLAEVASLPTTAWAESLAQLPNGDILAAGVISQSVQVWNLSTNTRLAELPGTRPVRIHPAGKLLVYGDSNGGLRSYDLAASQPIATLSQASQLPVISPDGRLVAAVSGYSVRLWDLYTGKTINTLGGPDAAITDLSFSADSKYIAGAAGGSAWVWDVNPQVTRPYKYNLYNISYDGNSTIYYKSVSAVALSPDNRWLAVGDSEHNVRLYEIASGKLIYHMTGHPAPLYRLRFSPDGTRLLSADSDGQIVMWNMASGAIVKSLTAHTGSIRGMILGLDGNLRAWANNTVWTLNPQDGALLHTTSIYSGTILGVSPAGDWLAVSSRLRMSIWDANTGTFSQLLEGPAGVQDVDYILDWGFSGVFSGFYAANFNADGTQLTTKSAGFGWVYIRQPEGMFQVQEQIACMPSIVVEDLRERSAFSPDGTLRVVTSQAPGTTPLLFLQNADQQEINRLSFPDKSRITALAFSPDARLIAIGQADGSIALVDVVEWKVIATFPAHLGAVAALVFSTDGHTLASGGDDGIVRMWGIP